MKWTKFSKPRRVELIKATELVDGDGNVVAYAGKDSPVPGWVTHYGHKEIGANTVRMYIFCPDAAPGMRWELSSGWFRRMKME